MRSPSHWLEKMPFSGSLELIRDLAESHALQGGPQGLKVAELIRECNYREICDFEVDYCFPGVTCEQIVHLRQALAYFTKLEDLEIGIDKAEVAMRKFLEAEELCKQTNVFLRLVREGHVSIAPRVASVLHTARRKVAQVLGDVPNLGALTFRFGPGATRATKRRSASIRRKLSERLQCSEELLPLVPYLLQELPHFTDIHSNQSWLDEDGDEWDRVAVEITPSKLSFVPKNAKTYRSICTEPGLNALTQLGYGEYLAGRLAAFGIDIRDQTLNQSAAREGSITGALATLDLSSASDTISTEIVAELLPLDWFVALSRARSRTVELPSGEVLIQSKFSSMGNGFTFPLETLIFWSLASSCTDGPVSVYGDDIIVPTEAYPLLVEVLSLCGFKVNLEKSYCTGPFRESCGKDYYSGIDVRPYYPREVRFNGQSLFVLRNFYARRGDTVRAQKVEEIIHPALRIYGPDGYGDGHLISIEGATPEWRYRKPKHLAAGYAGYFFDTYTTKQKRDFVALRHGEHVVPLYSIYRRAGESILDVHLNRTVFDGSSFGQYIEKSSLWDIHSPLPLPEDKGVKGLSLPGVAGYKKISIYTLGD